MTSLHVLLDEAMDRALMARPGLSYSDVARAAGMSRQALQRARTKACAPASLASVFDAIEELTEGAVRLDVGLVEKS